MLLSLAAAPMLLLCPQVRTVAAFGMEQGTVDKYDRALEYPEQVRDFRPQHRAAQNQQPQRHCCVPCCAVQCQEM